MSEEFQIALQFVCLGVSVLFVLKIKQDGARSPLQVTHFLLTNGAFSLY